MEQEAEASCFFMGWTKEMLQLFYASKAAFRDDSVAII